MNVCNYTRQKPGFSAKALTPDPASRGGELFWAQFFGAKAPKNRTGYVPPALREGGREMVSDPSFVGESPNP